MAVTVNVGKADKIIRVILGLSIIAGGVIFQSWWGLVGAVSLTTAAMGWCPTYLIFGINTNK
ncbi:MAG: DUF2892 domain-containing protein [Gammaproteobacteria bacterium]|nr:DUF2892 domain-containing protein [Gammaproteobacteria bacterium]